LSSLVVIAIIALLASIILASLNTARIRSRDAKRVADIKQIQLALEVYYNDNSLYPANIYAASGGISPNYLPTVPTDPNYAISSATCSTAPTTAGCYLYSGLVPSGGGTTCAAFHLGATLEQSSNTALNNDSDSAAGTKCTGSNDDFLEQTQTTIFIRNYESLSIRILRMSTNSSELKATPCLPVVALAKSGRALS
jgi:type II secretory pathway pseudopilin PulG